ncbi:MAG: primosomal protein N' [Cyclobacteriaceae bacterium]|nr:primosomal protein N' [Cyclobacteriaceae bacterium]
MSQKNLFYSQNADVFAEVIVPIPVPGTFHYKVPAGLTPFIRPGSRVMVPFGTKKILTGVVAALSEEFNGNQKLRTIIECLDDEPHINEKQLKVFQWMADYYMSTLGEVLNAALPSGLKLSSESFLQLHPYFETGIFTEAEQILIDRLQKSDTLSFSEARTMLNSKSDLKILQKLIDKEVILVFEQVKDRFTAKKKKCIRLNESKYLEKAALQELMEQLEDKPTQLEVLLAYLREVAVLQNQALNDAGFEKKLLVKKGISPSSLRTLIKKGVFVEFDKVVPRIEFGDDYQQAELTLSDVQNKAQSDILEQFERKQTVLLHGVTGSGKTEIYISLIRQVLDSGRQVLFLLPEIAITTQMVTRLRKIFGNAMGVYHSKYSDNERVEVWKGMVYGRLSFVMGVRSSVLLPFDDLGLIIIDEEHESSFKQYDPNPRYNARDVAQVLARVHDAKVLMGSATPSMESYFLAEGGKFGLVELHKRYGNATLPQMEMADLSAERKAKSMKGDFSTLLVNRIEEALSRKEQVIVFQNRRGYAHIMQCQDCGWIPDCHSCAVSLTYHMHRNHLKCHYCGHMEKVPYACPSCGSTRLGMKGFGTEKIEDDLKILFPEIRIQRMDLDTTRSKYSYQKILEDFEQGEIDILVGTQMISKGLHFDNVSLVGAFDADRMLHFPDFRATERTFQLLTQVSGRAGRSEKEGRVVIQSSNPAQEILSLIANHDYKTFYQRELQDRYEYGYPPYYRIIKILLRHKNEKSCEDAAQAFSEKLHHDFSDLMISEVHEPMVARIRNLYYRQILIKISRQHTGLGSVKSHIIALGRSLYQYKDYRQVQIIYDVDPY